MSERAKQLLEAERQLEEKTYGTPAEELGGPDATTTVSPADTVPPVAEGDAQPAPPQEPEAPKEDWEKRYKNLRSSRDSKLYEAERSLNLNQEQVGALQSRINELESTLVKPKESFKDLLSEDERDALGDTAVEAIEKVTRSQVASLEEELKAMKDKSIEADAEVAKSKGKAAYDLFINRLASVVPKYQELNTDKGFVAYLQEPDVDGTIRLNNLRSAERRGDVATVSRYMLDYKATPLKEDKLADLVAPKQTPSVTVATDPEADYLTMSQVRAHYDKHAKGGYKGKLKEFQEMDAKVDLYTSLGKIKR